jgi:uncharacterized membrane protein YdjX (TVP38/TMEM64 family)
MRANAEWMKLALAASIFVALFVSVSYVANMYRDTLVVFVSAGGLVGIAAFILLEAFCTVFLVPFDSSVLVPLAAHAWGPWQTALMSITGWTLGSAIAFTLARRYGRPVVERMIGAHRTAEAEGHAPHEHLFWWVAGTQAFIQVDFISYMFGLFTGIPLAEYALATALGDALPALFFSYVGTLPLWYEAAAIVGGLSVTGFLFWRFTRAPH